MNIIDRGKAFVERLRELAGRTAWDWRRCPYCGETLTHKHGSYVRRPWFLEGGRQVVRVQRHWCERCRRTYSEQSALLVRGSWYAREVQRCAVDHWQHVGSSVRRTAEWLRSLLGKQERWKLWRPLDAELGEGERCHLSGSTVERWLDRAGRAAEQTVVGQLAGVPMSGQVLVDGLWARLRGGAERVVLLLVDSVTGVMLPPVVVRSESGWSWARLLVRARRAGLALDEIRGVTSDGASGLIGLVGRVLEWANHQRCIFHVWRNLGGELALRVSEAAAGLAGKAATAMREQVRKDLVALIHGVVDARSEAAADAALARLKAHQLGTGLARLVEDHLDALLVYLLDYNRGLVRVAPEWCWRDFRLRLGHGRNEGSAVRLERTALVWQIYRNFEPAQARSERKRKYRRPGRSPLAMAGVPPNSISYLDALGV